MQLNNSKKKEYNQNSSMKLFIFISLLLMLMIWIFSLPACMPIRTEEGLKKMESLYCKLVNLEIN
jgi:hypothetical protein